MKISLGPVETLLFSTICLIIFNKKNKKKKLSFLSPVIIHHYWSGSSRNDYNGNYHKASPVVLIAITYSTGCQYNCLADSLSAQTSNSCKSAALGTFVILIAE